MKVDHLEKNRTSKYTMRCFGFQSITVHRLNFVEVSTYQINFVSSKINLSESVIKSHVTPPENERILKIVFFASDDSFPS